jgi:hypothetical protein
MSEQHRHEMQFKTNYASGAELWYCPTCGRQFLLSYPPNYQKIILEPGDESAMHSGGTGGLSMGQLHSTDAEALELPENIRASVEKILRDFD